MKKTDTVTPNTSNSKHCSEENEEFDNEYNDDEVSEPMALDVTNPLTTKYRITPS